MVGDSPQTTVRFPIKPGAFRITIVKQAIPGAYNHLIPFGRPVIIAFFTPIVRFRVFFTISDSIVYSSFQPTPVRRESNQGP